MRPLAWGAVWLGWLLTGSQTLATPLNLAYDDLARVHAPATLAVQSAIVERDALRAESRQELRWSDPELSFEREELGPAHEQRLLLNQALPLPWQRIPLREAWRQRSSAADARLEQETREALARLQHDYFAMAVLDAHAAELATMERFVERAVEIAASQRQIGTGSGLERRFVDLAAADMQAALAEARLERAWLRDRLATGLMLPAGTEIKLLTPVVWRPVELDPSRLADRLSVSSPQIRSQRLEREALQARRRAEGARWPSSLAVYGGLLRDDAEEAGLVAGIALGLPLFGQRGARIEELELRIRSATLAQQRGERDLLDRCAGLTRRLVELQPALESGQSLARGRATSLEALLLLLQEGRLSTPEFAAGLQLELRGMDLHKERLLEHFAALIELESLTGLELVRPDKETTR
jgi:outer membrane protein TolC